MTWPTCSQYSTYRHTVFEVKPIWWWFQSPVIDYWKHTIEVNKGTQVETKWSEWRECVFLTRCMSWLMRSQCLISKEWRYWSCLNSLRLWCILSSWKPKSQRHENRSHNVCFRLRSWKLKSQPKSQHMIQIEVMKTEVTTSRTPSSHWWKEGMTRGRTLLTYRIGGRQTTCTLVVPCLDHRGKGRNGCGGLVDW
jgi:hypothetical protein